MLQSTIQQFKVYLSLSVTGPSGVGVGTTNNDVLFIPALSTWPHYFLLCSSEGMAKKTCDAGWLL